MILVDNVIKYEPQGGEVRVNLAKNGAKAVFTVNNRGSVIADKDLPHIFDRFYRSEKSRTSGGVGLGLAIAKNIVNLHGGTIKAFSSESEGTTFKVEFSLKRIDKRKTRPTDRSRGRVCFLVDCIVILFVQIYSYRSESE